MGGSDFPQTPGETRLASIAMGPIPGGGTVLFASMFSWGNGSQQLWCSYKLPSDNPDASGEAWTPWRGFDADGYTPQNALTPAWGPQPLPSPSPQLAVCSASTVIKQNAVAWFMIDNGIVYWTPGYGGSGNTTQLWQLPTQHGGWWKLYEPNPSASGPFISPGSMAALGDDLPVLFLLDAEDPKLVMFTADSPVTAASGITMFQTTVFDPPPPVPMVRLVAAPLPNRHAQLWAVDLTGNIWSTWTKGELGSSSGWSPWTTEWNPHGTLSSAYCYFNNGSNAAGVLADGRVQLWVASSTGGGDPAFRQAGPLMTCWKETANDPNASWSPWEWFLGNQSFQTVAAGPLADGRLQVFAANAGGNIASTWKQKPATDTNEPFLQQWVGVTNPP
jgi:hypothetical protein